MIKVIYLVSELYPSGPINQAMNIVSSFDKEEVDATVITLFDERKESWMNKFLDHNIPIVQLHSSRRKLLEAKTRLLKYIKKNNIDVVHSSGFSADLINSMLGKHVATVSTFRSHISDLSERSGIITKIVSRLLFRYSMNKIQTLVGCSKSLAKDMQEDTGKHCEVVQNGADIDHYIPLSEAEKLSLRKELDIDSNKRIFISVGALEPRKNMLLIAKAFTELPDENILLIVGEGDERKDLEALATKSGNIRLIGKVNDPLRYYQASDFLISSSLAEGLPNTVLEAMSCGLPCILSNIGPHYEMLEYDKDTGIIFDKTDLQDLKSKINIALKWDYKSRSDRARNMIVHNLSKYVMAHNYTDIYRAALKRKENEH